ncbi:MAG: hypothetical protein Q8K50_13640 [Hydrogenophaga sp.]|uniref:hypothetical protein n=1 Tax=Hydrogenophaga sp. TaxID=1904254 RepID=UPI00271D809C|nr:hypothetical protein [Hydrogenophaga sp.]MDO9571935.1 hypothetical protein [Hydrogenophaga sp.]MDP2094913.1 hypothetical protein [Hydrogenophaga sp.]MDP3375041.1 hypothetical protein [Hydrogenophaga sp.]MDZ4239789.1 hypothetical protein [Hydrogenophaga sp.]
MNAVFFPDRPAVYALGVGVVLAALAFPAAAEKPEWVDKPGKHEKAGKSHTQRPVNDAPHRTASAPGVSVHIPLGGYFGEPQRQALRDHYQPQFKAGQCPPGLAKKGNGCLPPGQAKKWRVGRPLPSDVIYHAVPHSVSVQIGLPPTGHKYVRVAADILLIAIGTGMVIDAIEDLNGL